MAANAPVPTTSCGPLTQPDGLLPAARAPSCVSVRSKGAPLGLEAQKHGAAVQRAVKLFHVTLLGERSENAKTGHLHLAQPAHLAPCRARCAALLSPAAPTSAPSSAPATSPASAPAWPWESGPASRRCFFGRSSAAGTRRGRGALGCGLACGFPFAAVAKPNRRARRCSAASDMAGLEAQCPGCNQ